MNRTMTLPRTIVFPRSLLNKILIWLAVWVAFPLVMFYFIIGAIAADKLTVPQRVFVDTYTPAMFGLPYEDVRFPAADGQASVAAWYIPSQASEQVVVLVHGRNSSRTEMFLGHSLELAAALHEAGYAVMMIDLRGHGQSSDGRFTYGLSERYDLTGAVDWLVTRGFQPGKIGVLGMSMGSAVVIGSAADDERIGAVVSDSGYADIASLIEERWESESGLPRIFLYSTRLMIWLKYGYDITTSRPVDEIATLAPRPVLVVHCTNDRMIPYDHARQLQAAAPGAQLWTIPSCLHGQSYNANPAEYEARIIAFFSEGLQ